MKLDFSAHGLDKGVEKVWKIFVYYFVSVLVAGGIAMLNGYHPESSDVDKVVLLYCANALIAFLQKWLSTHKPE